MDTVTDIRNIRVIRAYRAQPLTEGELQAIVDTGRKTGSSKNDQAWDFITIRDPESLQRLSGVTPNAKHLPGAGAAIAQIVDAPDPEHARSVLWDLGRAAQNMMLAAWAMGIGSCPITVREFDLAAEVLQLPTHKECQYLIALGWPADPGELVRKPRAGGRKSYQDVVHAERW